MTTTSESQALLAAPPGSFCPGCLDVQEPNCAACGKPARVWLPVEVDGTAHYLALCGRCFTTVLQLRAEIMRAKARAKQSGSTASKKRKPARQRRKAQAA
jgi:hypothetical protein